MNFQARLKPQRAIQLRKLFSFIIIISMISAFFQPEHVVHATTVLTLTPITWKVIGLDSNDVNIGSRFFPIRVRVLNDDPSPASGASLVDTIPDELTAGNDTAANMNFAELLTDLALGNTDWVISLDAGTAAIYTIRVTNYDSSPVDGAVLSDVLGTGLSADSVICSIIGSNQCSGTVDLTALTGGGISLPALAPGEFYEIKLTANVTATSGSVTNTATVAPPMGTTDTNPGNNTSSDTDTVNLVDLEADFSVMMTNGETTVVSGSIVTYTIQVLNYGPSLAGGVLLKDILGSGLIPVSAACASAESNQCSGTVDLSALTGSGITLPDLAPGQSYEITLDAKVTAVEGTVSNHAVITPPDGLTETNSGNNSSMDTDTVTPAEYYILFIPLLLKP